MRQTRVAVQGFGTKTETFDTSIHEIKVVDAHGSHHSFSAIKRSALNLSIPPVPTKVVQRWKERGIEVSDADTTDSSEIWLLIGADYANQFLKEQRIILLLMEKWHGSLALAGFFQGLARWKQQSKTLAW